MEYILTKLSVPGREKEHLFDNIGFKANDQTDTTLTINLKNSAETFAELSLETTFTSEIELEFDNGHTEVVNKFLKNHLEYKFFNRHTQFLEIHNRKQQRLFNST